MFWSFLWFFMFFIWLWLLIIFRHLPQRRPAAGQGAVEHLHHLPALPRLFVYLIARGGKMANGGRSRSRPRMRLQYVQQTAATSSTARGRVAALAQLHDQGILDDTEYAQAKARRSARSLRPATGGCRTSVMAAADRYGGGVPVRYTYSRWDGTQRGFEPDADDILAAVTDDLIEHGDVNAALRRLMNDGLRSADGEAIAGCASCSSDCARLAEIASNASTSAASTTRSPASSPTSSTRSATGSISPRSTNGTTPNGGRGSAEEAARRAEERRLDLDLLPDDLAGKVAALQQHRFVSAEAERRFEALVDRPRCAWRRRRSSR